tara:strand:- start:38007 stop:38744 length:738 start_codon:yes stop_codon:yes gene_type:complete
MEEFFTPERIAHVIDFFSIPPDANFWTLINSPFLVAVIASIIGVQLNRRLNQTRANIEDAQVDANIAMKLAQDVPDVVENEQDSFERSRKISERRNPWDSVPSAGTTDTEESSDEQSEEISAVSEFSGRLNSELASASGDMAPSNEADFRAKSESIVTLARNFIRDQISADTDQRHQRTYRKISAHKPGSLAIALRERGQISDETEAAVLKIFRIWDQFARGKASNKPVPEDAYKSLGDAWSRVR